MTNELKTEFSKLNRARERGGHDLQQLKDILNATPICHFGYSVDGRPVVTPTCHWVHGDYVYWHGSRIARSLTESEGNEVCLTVTLFDGLVLARSAFHHSANYRSAMVFGKPELVDDDQDKTRTLEVFIEKLFPGRWDQLRNMSRKELDATTVLRLALIEGASKVRTGPPNDLEEDLSHPVWAGVIPLTTVMEPPITAPDMQMEVAMPAHVTEFMKRECNP